MSDPRDLAVIPDRVEWSERLAVGVAEIDAQHKELYRRVDRFLRALSARGGRSQIVPLVAYLEEYIREHFAAEQQMMELSEYAALGDHMAEHNWFEEEYRRLCARLDREGATAQVAREFVSLLVGWLDRHLGSTDRAFGAFLSGHRARLTRKPSA